MMANGPEHPALEADGEADRAGRLEQLRVRTRQLERQRIVAGPTMNRAELVALDVELCRVEAIKQMLAPGLALDPIHALGACPTRDVLCERPGTTQRSDQREDRGRPSWTPPLASR